MKYASTNFIYSFLISCCLTFCLHSTQINAQTLPSNFKDSLISANWNFATGFTWDITGQMYVWEKDGYVHVVDSNGVRRNDTLLNIREEVGSFLDNGFNGFVLDPNFRNNGYFYCLYTVDRHHLMNFGTPQYNANTDEYYNATITRLTRYTANAATNFSTLVPGSRLILLGETKKTGVPMLHESHGPGTLLFGEDGSLLVSVGDGASFDHVDTGSIAQTYYVQALADSIIRVNENCGAYRSQMPTSLNGKILRLNPANGNGLASNPRFNAAAPRSPESRMWALGVRNSFRMCLRPGSGSTDITAGDPGTIYSGDVGWYNWEEMNTCEGPNQNFGWPLYEGLESGLGYQNDTIYNRDEPNPFYPNGSCKPFLAFRELLKQPKANGIVTFPLLCNSSLLVPDSIPHWVHSRPDIDYAHQSATTRTGIFIGNNADVININNGASPVTGAMFDGYASIGGTWYTGNKFPVQYQNKYFHADYVNEWIKCFSYNAADTMVSVIPFAGGLGTIVHLALHPKNGALYYFRYPDQIRTIKYSNSVNNFPTAVASQNVLFGVSPLTVNFNGALSSDPENLALSYNWNFGDGTAVSTAQNPSHVFNAPANTPTTYTVTFTVTDNVGQSDVKTLKVYVNNTPPQITIVSPVNNSLYTMSGNTVKTLNATAVDNEHSAAQLSYQWQKIFHHNQHTHPDPPVNSNPTTSLVTPAGCNGETYFYEFKITVTDAAGLSSTASTNIYPACSPPVSNFSANFTSVCAGTAIQFSDLSTSLPDNYQWTFTGGSPSSSTQKNPTVTYATAGTYSVTLNATNGYGGTPMTKTNYISVVNSITATITGNSSICQGQSTILTANAGAGFTYQWQENGANISGATNQTLTVTDSGSYRVIISSGPGCTGTSANKVVTLSGTINATITASGSTTICAGSNLTFSATTGTGYNYQWFKNGVAISGATNSTLIASSQGSYYSFISSGGCSGNSNTLTLTVINNPTPAISYTTPISFCSPGNVVLTSSTFAGVTYQWQKNGSNISGAVNRNYTAPNAGSYRVRQTANGCTKTSPAISVSNATTVTAAITANGTTVCNGNTVTLSVTNAIPGYGFQWKNNGSNIAGATASTYVASVSGSYTCLITATCGSATSNTIVLTGGTINATVNPSSNQTICSGGSVLLSANNGAGYTYQWKKNTVNISGATSSTYLATTTGNYSVAVSDACASAVSNATVVTVTAPTATVSPASATICAGSAFTFTANTGANYTYQWYRNTFAISGATNITYTTTNQGTYYVIVTQSGSCTDASGNAVLSVINNPIPTATPSGSTTFCAGQSVTITSNSFAGITYQWEKNGTAITGATQQSYIATTTGNYRVRQTANGCTKTSATVSVTVNCRLAGDAEHVDVVKASAISIYPNPFSSTIKIYPNSGDEIVELLNCLGQIIYSGNTIEQQNFSYLSKGIYFLKVTGERNSVVKLMKE